MAFKPIDPKRDEFRRYLERAGVIEALTKIFVRLVKERPENPMEYLLNNLGDARLQADHEAFMRTELEEARAEIQRLRNIVMKLDPTALEEIKETTSSDKTQNAEGASEEKTESNTNLDLNLSGAAASTASDEVVEQAAGNENVEKCADNNPSQSKEINLDALAKDGDKNIASPQLANPDEVADQLTDPVGAAAKLSNDNIIEGGPNLTGDKGDANLQPEEKQTNKETE